MAFASTINIAQQGIGDRLVALFSGTLERIRKAHAFRKTLRELQSLPDNMLVDMGLNRSMLRRVAHQAVYED